MPKAVAESFLDLVRRSQLVEKDRLDRFLDGYRKEVGEELPERPEAISQALVEAGLLTQWQAEKLLAGKHRGFILGKYKFLRQLGRGGMSTVYLAEHMLMNRKVAIKVLPQNRVTDSTYLERFYVEARAAAKLDDPNIVRAYDIDSTSDGKTHYLIMEYVDGQDLHVLVKEKGRLDYDTAADYIAQVATGLEHAHEMGLVHRDIKPANCLLDRNGTVKLLDMGLARLIGDEASLTLDNNENVLGTADYLAPEQALDSHKADSRADIYSLGCTFYYLLTGHPPFPEGSITERLMKHQRETAPSILKERPDAPPTLLHICEKMMLKDPNERYQTAGDVAERLAEWLADRGREVGDSTKNTGTGSGIGSDAFKGFAATFTRQPGSLSGIGGEESSKKAPSSVGKPLKVESNDYDDHEIGLAPLEEDAPRDEDSYALNESSSSSGDLAEALKDTVAEGPHKSLIEEAIEKEERAKKVNERFVRDPGEINPLRPPGYVNPKQGPPVLLYVGIGLGVLVVLGVVLALVL
ncbi:MAG: serine/threonine protein kinase [Planctomycetales bacterium]|nr:serine/threonine protein kinase [Planctomycetales bacterium]